LATARQEAGFAPIPKAPAQEAGSEDGSQHHKPRGVHVGGSRKGRRPQPKLEELEAQVAALSHTFSHLNKENAYLKLKLKALERVVPTREQSVGFLSAVAQVKKPQEVALKAEPLALTAQVRAVDACARPASRK
jgi:hypothetical protein